MPSFDIVSEADMQEVDNAINSVKREIGQRFDFKGGKSSIELKEKTLTMLADDDTRLKAMTEMLKVHFTRRNVDPKALDFQKPEMASGNMVRQDVIIKQGIDQDTAKIITKEIKNMKSKTQAAIRGEELRITGKKRDDLQEAISHIKELNIDLPLQFINFRD